MNEEEIRKKWDEICLAVRDEMGGYAYQFVTPLSFTEDLQFGQALGTGNYIEFNKKTYLLMNDHVVDPAWPLAPPRAKSPPKPPPKIQKTILRRACGILASPLSYGHMEPSRAGGQNPTRPLLPGQFNGA